MKKLRCQMCDGTWIVEENDLEKQRVCPCCASSIQGKVEFDTYDSLDKAIYGAITKMGAGVLLNLRQLSGFMMDTAPNLKKEIRIFSKTVTDEYVSYIKTLFDQDVCEAETTIRKLRQLFIEEEGLSESWADMICEGLHGALLYNKGIGCTRLINVEIGDFEPSTRSTERSITVAERHVEDVKASHKPKIASKTRKNTSSANTTPPNVHYTTTGDPEGLCEITLLLRG